MTDETFNLKSRMDQMMSDWTDEQRSGFYRSLTAPIGPWVPIQGSSAGGNNSEQRRFIAEMRAMQPDAVMSERLNELERKMDSEPKDGGTS